MKLFFLSIFLIMSSWQTNQQSAELTVEIHGIQEYKGFIMISIYDETKEFLSHDVLQGKRVQLSGNKKILIDFKDLKPGKYAVAVYHDENSNEELDTNMIGIPKEPYGFSNNHSTTFGPPSFEKASFMIEKGDNNISINL